MDNTSFDFQAKKVDEQILLRNLMEFVRLLRELGLNIGLNQSIDLVKALTLVDVGQLDDVYSTARCILVKRHDDLPLFDLAFALFWRKIDSTAQDRGQRQNKRSSSRSQTPPPAYDSGDRPSQGARSQQVPQLRDWLRQRSRDRHSPAKPNESSFPTGPAPGAPAQQGPDAVLNGFTYSPAEQLWHKDFSEFTKDEIIEAEQLIPGLDKDVPLRSSRRMVPSRRGKQLDLRRTIRHCMRRGGEFVRLSWKAPKKKQRSLVIISDISGSMEKYTRLLLRFMHVMRNGLKHAEVFVFSTQLTRITREFAHRRVDQAISHVTEYVSDWSGGTRIGQALHTFNRQWARRVLGRGTIVVIISDGWDQGELDLLREEMAHLQRRCYRLVWMNPLLGQPDYVPRSVGMLTALPFVDDFLPAHNLASLSAFVEQLSKIDTRRPVRRQGRSGNVGGR